MLPFSIRLTITKAVQDYKKQVRFYLALGVVLTAVVLILELATQYCSHLSGYSALVLYKELPPFESMSQMALFFKDALSVYLGRLVALHPVWLAATLSVVAFHKVLKLCLDLFVYAVALVVSGGRPLNDQSVRLAGLQTSKHFLRYIGATLLYGIVVLCATAWWLLPIIWYSGLEMPWGALLSGLFLGGLGVIGSYVSLSCIARFYLYPYCLINQEVGVRKSLQESNRLAAPVVRKIIGLLALLYLPLFLACAAFSQLCGVTSLVYVVVCGFVSVGMFFPFTSLVFSRVYRFLI